MSADIGRLAGRVPAGRTIRKHMSEDITTGTTDAIALLRERAALAEAALAEARHEIEALRAAGSTVERDAMVLDRLIETLRWEDGPHALRLVLPLARLIRRLGRSIALRSGAGGVGSGTAGGAAPGHRRSRAARLAVRIYGLTRPVALPVAMRLHALTGRVLGREAYLARSTAEAGNSAAGANADLLRSIEAAMLTLALQRRDGPP